MNTPIVSVLMPIYNTDITVLRSAIESILSQTFSNFEYLIVNDSPHNYELDRAVASYMDARIVYIKNDKNIGLEESTNKLIQAAKGKYLAIFDHDDISLPERLEKQVEYLDTHPTVGICSAQFRVFGKENWTSSNPVHSEDIKRSLESVSCVSHSTSMIRKSTLIENKIKYEKKFFPAASYRIITQLALVSDVHNLEDVLLEYRMGDDNTSVIHADKRQSSRDKVSTDYIESRKAIMLRDTFKFEKVEKIGNSNNQDERRYYKAVKGKDRFFVKSDKFSYENEYNLLKKAYGSDKKYFLEPVDFRNGEVNYLVTRWNDDPLDLEEYLAKNTISSDQKDIFVKDLYNIFSILRKLRIVHRDIIPRNFMVTNGHLTLIDFYWAIQMDEYEEYDYVKEDIRVLGQLGEGYSAGVYEWDDAHSFYEVAKRILGNSVGSSEYADKIAALIGERVVSPTVDVFRKTIERQEYFNEQLRKENSELKSRISLLDEKNTELSKAIDELQQHNEIISQDNDKIVKSLSWKSTRPFRIIMRGAKKMIGK